MSKWPVNRYDGTSRRRTLPFSKTDVWIRPSSTPVIVTTCGLRRCTGRRVRRGGRFSAGIGIGIGTAGTGRRRGPATLRRYLTGMSLGAEPAAPLPSTTPARGLRRRRGGGLDGVRRQVGGVGTGGDWRSLRAALDAPQLVVTGPLEGDPGAGEVLDPAVGTEGHVPDRPVGPAVVEERVEGDVEALDRRRRRRAGRHGDVGSRHGRPGSAPRASALPAYPGGSGAAGGAGAAERDRCCRRRRSAARPGGASRPRAAASPRGRRAGTAQPQPTPMSVSVISTFQEPRGRPSGRSGRAPGARPGPGTGPGPAGRRRRRGRRRARPS